MTSPCPHCKGDVLLTDPVQRSESPSVSGELLAPEWAEQVLRILRWLAILPGAFLAATIAGGAIMFIFGSGALSFFGLERYLNLLLSGLASGAAAVLAAAWIAPSERKTVPCAVTAVVVIIFAGAAVLSHLSQEEWFKILSDLAIAGGAAAALVARVQEEVKERFERLHSEKP